MEMREPQQLWRLKRRLVDLIDEKEKKTRKNMKIIDLIDCVGNFLKSAMTYIYVGCRI
jgi:uncharacterized protein YeeX (DUF496 family)